MKRPVLVRRFALGAAVFGAVYGSTLLRVRSLSHEAFELGQSAAARGDFDSAHAHFRRAESLSPGGGICCAREAREARNAISSPPFRLEVEESRGHLARELPDTMEPASAVWSGIAALALLAFVGSLLASIDNRAEVSRHYRWWHPVLAVFVFVSALYLA